MKAIRIHEHGGPEVLQYADVPDPTPQAHEAVVKIDAVGRESFFLLGINRRRRADRGRVQ